MPLRSTSPDVPLRRLLAALLTLAFLAGACTGSDGDGEEDADSGDATSTSVTSNPRGAVEGLATLCETAMSEADADVAGFALDPATSGQVASIPDDQVDDASDVLIDCLGDDGAGEFVTAKNIITGIPLAPEASACFAEYLADSTAILTATLQRIRLATLTDSELEPLVTAMTDCVPNRYLGAALQAEESTSYLAATDLLCLDATDDTTIALFWRFQLAAPQPEPSSLTDDEVEALVMPLYECIDTGTYVAAGTGVSLSQSSRECIGAAATEYGFWESKLAERRFDRLAYEEELSGCLNPEEAFAVLGTPIPVDDPETSHFSDVDECWAALDPTGSSGDVDSTDDGAESTEGELLVASEFTGGELRQLAADLVDCAGPEGAAGRMAAMTFGTRALPKGSYACILPHAEAAPEDLLAGRLLVEAGIPAGSDAELADAGAAYVAAASDCVPMNMATRDLWTDFSNPSITNTIDFLCIDEAYAADPGAKDAYWRTVVIGGATAPGGGTPNEQAAAAVAPLYGCVSPGAGFALAAIQDDLVIDEDQAACIDQAVATTGVLEARLVGAEPAEGAFNEAISSCLPEMDEWRRISEEKLAEIRGG